LRERTETQNILLLFRGVSPQRPSLPSFVWSSTFH
jgi:hypothetical protein